MSITSIIELCLFVAVLGVGVLTLVALPLLHKFLVEKLGKEKADALLKYGIMAVRFAEQKGTKNGVENSEKKQMALGALRSFLSFSKLGKNLDEVGVEAVVEAAVLVFNQQRADYKLPPVASPPPTTETETKIIMLGKQPDKDNHAEQKDY